MRSCDGVGLWARQSCIPLLTPPQKRSASAAVTTLDPLEARRLELALSMQARLAASAQRQCYLFDVPQLRDIVESFLAADVGYSKGSLRAKVWTCLRPGHYDSLQRFGGDFWHIDVLPGLLHQIAHLSVPLDVWADIKSSVLQPLQQAPSMPLPLTSTAPTADANASASAALAPAPGGGEDDPLVPSVPRRQAEAFYRDLAKEQLVECCLSKDEQLDMYRVKLKQSQRQVARRSEQLVRADPKAAPTKDVFSLERCKKGKGTNLSFGGQLALALRTVLSSASASAVGMSLLEDFYHSTVNRSIKLFAACLLQQSRSHSVDHKMLMEQTANAARAEGGPDCLVQLSLVAFSSDATNSAVLHRSKLHSTEVYTFYFPSAALIQAEGRSAFTTYGIESFSMPDLQRVLSGTAESTYSLLKKQVSWLYLDLWPEEWPKDSSLETLVSFSWNWAEQARKMRADKVISLKVWAYTSDGGSDQSKFKKVCNCATMASLNTLFVAWPCILHCGALISKGALTTIDDWLIRNKLGFRFFLLGGKDHVRLERLCGCVLQDLVLYVRSGVSARPHTLPAPRRHLRQVGERSGCPYQARALQARVYPRVPGSAPSVRHGEEGSS